MVPRIVWHVVIGVQNRTQTSEAITVAIANHEAMVSDCHHVQAPLCCMLEYLLDILCFGALERRTTH